jgi:UDP-N-acetyl-2-amino-2-deoxyglucuronate dehydrogenase
VYAQARTAAHERIEVEDVVCATVEFAGGAIGTIMASTAAYPGFPARLGVHGTRGGAVIEGDRLATFATVDGVSRAGEAANAHAVQVATGGTRAATRAVDEAAPQTGTQAAPAAGDVWGQAHRAQLLDFIDAAEQGRRPLVDGVEGRGAVELVRAVYESARTGAPVTP